MRKDKAYILQLRRGGKSYREIQKIVPISRATLTAWLKNETWSSDLVHKNIELRNTLLPTNIASMVAARKEKLTRYYEDAEVEAVQLYEIYKNDPLFWAGLMAYTGAGDKHSKNIVRLTSSEFHLHKLFIRFCLKYLDIPRGRIKCCLIITPDHNESLCIAMWSNLIEVPRDQFHKTQILNGKEMKRKLQYGVAMSIISSTVLKKKLQKWLSLAQDEKFDNAVMV